MNAVLPRFGSLCSTRYLSSLFLFSVSRQYSRQPMILAPTAIMNVRMAAASAMSCSMAVCPLIFTLRASAIVSTLEPVGGSFPCERCRPAARLTYAAQPIGWGRSPPDSATRQLPRGRRITAPASGDVRRALLRPLVQRSHHNHAARVHTVVSCRYRIRSFMASPDANGIANQRMPFGPMPTQRPSSA